MAIEEIQFSVIIPTRDRPQRLASCLASLARLDYPRDQFEVIVVDDGGKEPLAPVTAEFQDTLDLRLIRQVNTGPARARNNGAARARRQFLVFTDDDCDPAPDWLSTLSERFRQTPNRAIAGRIVNAAPGDPYAATNQMLTDYLWGYYNCDNARTGFCTSKNLALPADYFRSIGGFDPRFSSAGGEDRELSSRWLHYGYGVTCAPEVIVYYSRPMTFATFCAYHFKRGSAAGLFRQAHAERSRRRTKLEPLSFYFGMFRYPFRRQRSHQRWVQAALLFLSQAANAAGFLCERAEKALQRA
jgi:glycosyltransferase involved in cell wall biosynthesis